MAYRNHTAGGLRNVLHSHQAFICVYNCVVPDLCPKLKPAAKNGRPSGLSGRGIDVWSARIWLIAGGGRIPWPWTTEILTPAFSRMVCGVENEIAVSSVIGDAKTQDLPSPPWLRTHESRLKGGALESNFSNAETIYQPRKSTSHHTLLQDRSRDSRN